MRIHEIETHATFLRTSATQTPRRWRFNKNGVIFSDNGRIWQWGASKKWQQHISIQS